LVDAETRLQQARDEATKTLALWQTAAQRVEALERLEQRQLHERTADEARRESVAVDELVTARFVAESSVGRS
jgi:flagellar export protein FliJ